MFIAILTLLSALSISGVAIFYSVIGLATIFPGAFWPVVIMGSVLEVGKLVTASWLYRNWKQTRFLLKTYLTIAVVVLSLITSMGIFGFLSKAHLEQTAMSDEQVAQISVLQGKIVRSSAKITRWTDEIDRMNRGENVRVDNIIQGEEEQLTRLYKRIDDEKEALRLNTQSSVQVLKDKIEENNKSKPNNTIDGEIVNKDKDEL